MTRKKETLMSDHSGTQRTDSRTLCQKGSEGCRLASLS